jgi:hypothetical protein
LRQAGQPHEAADVGGFERLIARASSHRDSRDAYIAPIGLELCWLLATMLSPHLDGTTRVRWCRKDLTVECEAIGFRLDFAAQESNVTGDGAPKAMARSS